MLCDKKAPFLRCGLRFAKRAVKAEREKRRQRSEKTCKCKKSVKIELLNGKWGRRKSTPFFVHDAQKKCAKNRQRCYSKKMVAKGKRGKLDLLFGGLVGRSVRKVPKKSGRGERLDRFLTSEGK